MRSITLEQFQQEVKQQGVPREHFAVRCPVCNTVQSMASLIAAGCPESEVEQYVGFSCVGRFTKAGPFHKGDRPGKGCDWTLGGLFRVHKLEIVTPDGEKHMHFDLASPAEAKALMEKTRPPARTESYSTAENSC